MTSAGPPPAHEPFGQIPQLSPAGHERLRDLSTRSGIRRVHVLAWRDLDDPAAGGSELHISTIAALWAQAGLDVTIRTSHTPGFEKEVQRDGYTVIRRGSRFGIFLRAPLAEMAGRHGNPDALIEIWNGMPFMSPVWRRHGAHNVWLHHVHASMWTMMLGKIGHLGIILEERIAPRFYRKMQMVTLSDSSAAELQGLGFDPASVAIVPPGVDSAFSPGGSKSTEPLMVAVGRLAPVKRFEMLIDAAIAVRRSVPNVRLVIVGDGPRRDSLQAQIDAAGATDWIQLAGRVGDDELIGLYRSAWVLTSSSEREGWGMTITEAAACGTPAVVTRIAGHSDAVAEGISGLLSDTTDELAGNLVRVLNDGELRQRLSSGALTHATAFTWERTAIETFGLLAASAGR